MVISDENKNNPTLIKPINLQEMGSRKFGVEIRPNRGALSMINQNVARAHPYPCVVNKKVLSGTHEICDKLPPHPAHRPITRKFAAQIASTQQHCLEKTKKPDSSSVQSFRVWEDCPVIDEEHKEATDPPVPMSLEQTEAVPDEEEQMEVEMEDIFEEPVMDIDSCDAKNPLAVVDYVHDVYVYYRKMEVN
ncbi:G2/mitotic-specific cyclin-1-like isoform X1 [Camellia sinensis]|uniref:Uncharacterized protein n=1 Tax=Camellia sinensis var. sinensis TaxID=542762 RepID=A0A4S4EMC2_CAMSN|nr:G2/mitotic-specific cyclin-1-like isoform X1 [Camellia sinensis]THG17305.1 hypothetical protein TEA_008589 [Camellia sinensis var. sinensis]